MAQQAPRAQQPNSKSTPTSGAAAVVKKERQARGEGPLTVTYVDADGKNDHKRVPDKSLGIVINPKTGTAKQYNAAELPEATRNAMINFAVASRMKMYITNHGQKDGSDAVVLADRVWGELLAGRVYSKAAEGGKPKGRKFIADDYALAMQITYAKMAKAGLKKKNGDAFKPMTDEEREDFKAKLEGMAPKERTAQIKTYMGNKVFEKEYKLRLANKVDVKDLGDTSAF